MLCKSSSWNLLKLAVRKITYEKNSPISKFFSGLVIVKSVTANLNNRINNLQKLKTKIEQHNKRKKVEIWRILNEIPEENLENKKICKSSEIIINFTDMEGWIRIPLGCNSTNYNKHVTVKFGNRKHFELMSLYLGKMQRSATERQNKPTFFVLGWF